MVTKDDACWIIGLSAGAGIGVYLDGGWASMRLSGVRPGLITTSTCSFSAGITKGSWI